MATIGTFTLKDGSYTGQIQTLVLKAKVKLALQENKPSDDAPDYRIFVGGTEVGAAWKKIARTSERPYLAVKLDDPTFPAPIFASLHQAEDGGDGYNLVWSRPKGRGRE
ncbi:MAG: DUF736 domain-containing protein [Sneathiellaceae bacterium]